MTDDDGYRELTAADLAHRWRERTSPEHVTDAVSFATGPEGELDEYGTLERAARRSLLNAWDELHEARGTAIGGVWSMKCDWAVTAIIGLTRLVGPMPWDELPVALILDGIYEQVHEAIGQPTPLSDEDRRQAREVLDRRSRPAS